jgi:hypothetical protein
MKKLLLILLCLPMIGFGQVFIKEYNTILTAYEQGFSVKQTSDGGYIILGISNDGGFDSTNINLVRTDASGTYLWHRNSGGQNQDYAFGNEIVHQTLDGGFITLATYDFIAHSNVTLNNNSRVWLIKRDASGNQEWEKKFDADSCLCSKASLEPTSDGGYIIFARACDAIIWLIKTDSIGNTLWTKTHNPYFGGFVSPTFMLPFGGDIEQTSDGGYIMTGMQLVADTNAPGGIDRAPAIMKLDPQGNIDWVQPYYTPTYFGNVSSIEQTTDGGFVLSGSLLHNDTMGLIGINNGTFAIKTDSNGDTIWTKFDTTILYSNYWSDIKQTTDGGYIYYRLGNAGNGTWFFGGITITKLYPSGGDDWSTIFQNFQGKTISGGMSIEQTSDGGYIMTGALSDTIALTHNTLLIKTDGNGNVTSTFNIPIPNANKKLQKVVDVLGRQTKGKKNEPLFYIYDDGTVEKRITIE